MRGRRISARAAGAPAAPGSTPPVPVLAADASTASFRSRVASLTLTWSPHHSTASGRLMPSPSVNDSSASPARSSYTATSASRSANAVTTETASPLRRRSCSLRASRIRLCASSAVLLACCLTL